MGEGESFRKSERKGKIGIGSFGKRERKVENVVMGEGMKRERRSFC